MGGTIRHKIKIALEKNLLTGLLVILPVALTYFVLAFVINVMDTSMEPFLAEVIRRTGLPLPIDFKLPGLGFVLILLFIFLVGLLGSNFIGKKVVDWGHLIVEKIPIVRTIYQGIKKLVDTFSESKAGTFEKITLVQFPHEGLKALGLVSCDTEGEVVQSIDKGDFISVMVSPAPNVITCFLIFYPVDQNTPLEMSPEEGFKTLVSLGTLDIKNQKENLEEIKREGD